MFLHKRFAAIAIIGTYLGACITPPIQAATYRSPDEVDLPPIEQRQIIGTWQDEIAGTICTMGIEKVNSKFYKVQRCADGSGGSTDIELVKISDRKYKPKTASRNGDYYLIDNSKNLGIFDNQGIIITL
jgi:hypothetical protein